MITFEHVSKAFDSLKVLDDLSLHIAADQIVGVVGPSGVGEDHHPQADHGHRAARRGHGDAWPRAPWATCSRSRGCCPGAPPSTTWPRRCGPRGWTRTRPVPAAARWLERVELDGFERYHPAELSGGMAQRVSIARAFAAEPRILLMDEPFSNMDVALKGSLIAILQGIIKERETTVVYVTHELTEALRLADRIVELTPDRTAARARSERPRGRGPGVAGDDIGRARDLRGSTRYSRSPRAGRPGTHALRARAHHARLLRSRAPGRRSQGDQQRSLAR